MTCPGVHQYASMSRNSKVSTVEGVLVDVGRERTQDEVQRRRLQATRWLHAAHVHPSVEAGVDRVRRPVEPAGRADDRVGRGRRAGRRWRGNTFRTTAARTPKRVSVVVIAEQVVVRVQRVRRARAGEPPAQVLGGVGVGPLVDGEVVELRGEVGELAAGAEPGVDECAGRRRVRCASGRRACTGSGPGVFQPMYFTTAPIDLSLHTPVESCQPAAAASS